MTVPIEDHDVGRVDDGEKAYTVDDLVCQHKLKVFAS
jgi:hypothetical protein